MKREEFIEKVEAVTERMYGYKGHKEFPGWGEIQEDAVRISSGCTPELSYLERKLQEFRQDIEKDLKESDKLKFSTINETDGIYFELGESIDTGLNEGGFKLKVWTEGKRSDSDE